MVQTAATILCETSALGVAVAVIRLSRQLFKTLHVFKKDVASASADSRLHVQPWLWPMLLVHCVGAETCARKSWHNRAAFWKPTLAELPRKPQPKSSGQVRRSACAGLQSHTDIDDRDRTLEDLIFQHATGSLQAAGVVKQEGMLGGPPLAVSKFMRPLSVHDSDKTLSAQNAL